MLFNSLEFLIFFPAVVGLYFMLPHRLRWPLLLAASYYFYMCWKPEYVILIMASTLVDYWAAIRMGRSDEKRPRRKYLILSLVANLGLLFSFKYFNFFNASIHAACDSLNIFYGVQALDVLLPVGISFYTFQTLSYTIDVYRGDRAPERHLGIFAVYVSFFPQLVAGPIERSTRLMPQFFKKQEFKYERVVSGLRLMLWGLFKKVVIADRLAVYVNEVYGHPGDFSGGPLLLATYFFAFQIYCDFSGYTNIAIGSARVLGFDLMANFRRPYFATSIADFWRRWHISLSTWFRDYVYIPLGGKRVTRARWYYNLLAVFVLSGLWHGANWTFVAWGALHGSYLVLSNLTTRLRTGLSHSLGLARWPRMQRLIRIVITFHLVVVAWVFFRAGSLSDAWLVLTRMVYINFGTLGSELPLGFYPSDLYRGWFDITVATAAIGLLITVQLAQRSKCRRVGWSTRPVWIRWSAYYAVALAIIILGVYDHAEFIYFQF